MAWMYVLMINLIYWILKALLFVGDISAEVATDNSVVSY